MISLMETSAVVFEADESTSTRTPVIPDEFKFGAAGLKRIYKELSSLCAEPDEKTPTDYALIRTIDILESAAYEMMRTEPKTPDGSADFPVGFVAGDGEGGIRIEWWHMKNTAYIWLSAIRKTCKNMYSSS